MNRNLNSNDSQSAPETDRRIFMRLRKVFIDGKHQLFAACSTVSQEKLPIIYANIRV